MCDRWTFAGLFLSLAHIKQCQLHCRSITLLHVLCTAVVLQLDIMEVLYRALRGADVTNAEAIAHYLPQPNVPKMMAVRMFVPAAMECIWLISRVPCMNNWVAPIACEKSMCFAGTRARPCSSQRAVL